MHKMEYVITILVLLLCLLVYLYVKNRNRNLRSMQVILDVLDQSLSGKHVQVTYDESVSSAIIQRLNRLLQVNTLKKEDAQKERDNVKSLVSDISHQVRTPLSNIVLYADLLKEQKNPEQRDQIIDKIQTQSNKLDFLIKELVKSSRVEQELIQVSYQLVKVANMVHAACQLVEMKAIKKQIMMQYEEVDIACFADARWSVEAIGNVLDNAIKYAPYNSSIYISTKLYDSFVCICIQDEGIGIEESLQGRIFQRFYRVPNTQDTTGFGIGLYLVREVLTKQGGYVKVVSQPNKGACFQLYFRRNEIPIK